jgi:hypothetical protein
MRLKTQRKAIYAAMGLTVLALVGGFTLASLQLGGSTSSSHQGSHTTEVSAVPGLNWTGTDLNVSMGVTNTSSCSASPGCNVSSQSAVVCAGSTHTGTWCAADDFIEQVVLTTTFHKSMGGIANMTVFVVTSSQSYEGETFFFSDSATNAIETITLDFDVGNATSGPAGVTDVTVVVTV